AVASAACDPGDTCSSSSAVGVNSAALIQLIKMLVEAFEKTGEMVDVCFLPLMRPTPRTNFSGILAERWKGRLRSSNYSERPGSQLENAIDALSLVQLYSKAEAVSYKYVVLLRHDMILKENIAEKLAACCNPTSSIIFPFRESGVFHPGGGMPWSDPVADSLQVVPWPRFDFFLEVLLYLRKEGVRWPCEDLKEVAVVSRRLMEVSVETLQWSLLHPEYYGDSDPLKVWNPMYKLAGRDESLAVPPLVCPSHNRNNSNKTTSKSQTNNTKNHRSQQQ
ncbi:unnamed protein product, partial [Polarella glacialis]